MRVQFFFFIFFLMILALCLFNSSVSNSSNDTKYKDQFQENRVKKLIITIIPTNSKKNRVKYLKIIISEG